MIIVVLFSGGIMVTWQLPAFAVHAVALDRDIDTNALFYTDIDDITLAEQWVTTHIVTTSKLLPDQQKLKIGEVR